MNSRTKVACGILCCGVFSQTSAGALENIDECRKSAIDAIKSEVREYTSPVVQLRSRAGVLKFGGCDRQEQRGSLAFAPPSDFAFENMTLHQGPWQNATLESATWGPSGTAGTFKNHGHGCDRTDDSVASAWWTGTIRRVVTPTENETIWRKCVEQETVK